MSNNDSNSDEPQALPFVAPCREVSWKAPFGWLKLSVQDLRRAPEVSFIWGAVIALVSVIVAGMAFKLGRFALLALLLSGFTFIAPLLGVALYSVSRSLEHGQKPDFSHTLKACKNLLPQAGVFFMVQLVILLLWSRAGMLTTAFFPASEMEQELFWSALKTGEILTSGEGSIMLNFLLLGSALGAIFATLTFFVTAVSLPMLADKQADMITAMLTSINACLRNKAAMFVWGLLICLLLIIGVLTFFIGFVVIMPLLAYGAWHAYKDVIDARIWPDRSILTQR